MKIKKLPKLKACVFCGGSGRLLKNDEFENQTWDIDCQGCEWSLHGFDADFEAVKEWNDLREVGDSRNFGTPFKRAI